MERLLQKIQKNWVTHLFPESELKPPPKNTSSSKTRVLLCVSGGCDSVAQFHLLYRLRALLKLELQVLHFNHKLRPESEEEQRFVESLAIQHGLNFHCKVATHLIPGKPGLQEQARNWRKQEACKVLEEIGGQYISTGHHADDQTETVLMKWLRGVHLSHLQGMPWKNPPFIRPLLHCKKNELIDFLERNELEWMEDHSNQSTAYTRNQVRLELIPLLEDLTRNGLQTRIQNLSEQSLNLKELLTHQHQKWLQENNLTADSDSLNLSSLLKEPRLLQEEIIHHFITNKTGQSLSYEQLWNVLELFQNRRNNRELHLSDVWKIVLLKNQILIKPHSREKASSH